MPADHSASTVPYRQSQPSKIFGAQAPQIKRFGPPQFGKILGPQVRLTGAEKLVQLRWLDRGAAEHGVNLAAMMDLVLKQMGQQAQATVMLRGVTGDGHDFAEVGVAHLLAIGDQPAVDVGLFAKQVRCRRDRARLP